MSFWTKARDAVTNSTNPANWSAGGHSVATDAGKYLPKTKGFGKNVQSALQHPLSFATGGLLGGKGGTFEVPSFSGGSKTNALSGSDQYGNSANKNREIAAIIGTIVGGEALAGGDSAGAGAGTETGVETGVGTVNPAAGMTTTPLGTGAPTVLNSTPSLISQIGSGLKNYGPMAMSAISAMKGSSPTDAQNQMQGISDTQQQAGQHLIDQYNSGQLNAGDSYNVAQWEQQQTQSTKEYYDKAGLGDSSMAQQAIAGIQAQASSMRQQTLQNYLTQGLSALGNAATTLSPIISQQIAADQRAQQAQSDFFKALASMNTTG